MKTKKVSILFLLLIILTSTIISVASDPINLEGINKNGRFLVPMRSIFENLGATVNWDGLTKTVTGIKDDVEVVLTIDDTNAYINGELNVLDVPAALEAGRTYVPVRFVGEALGAKVGWDGTIRMASVSLGDTQLQIYEVLPPEPDITITENISHSINPRVVKNGGNQKISLEAVITDDNGSPIEGVEVQFFISSKELDRSNQVVYENNVTDKNGRIRASYTTLTIDNDKSFIVKIAAMVNDSHVEATSNFLVSNTPTAKVTGTVYHPTNGQPAANARISAAHRHPHVDMEIAFTDVNGRYDANVPINVNREYFIGAEFEELMDVGHTYMSSQSFISPSRFSLDLRANITQANVVHEIDFDHGIVKGQSFANAEIYAMPYINGVLNNKLGIAIDALYDGSYLVPLPAGTYKFADMKSERTMKDNIVVTKGETIDIGIFTR